MKTREQVANILRDIRDLPTLPTVASKVMEMTRDPQCSQIDLAAVVEQDPAIAARLLKLVNSPFYGIAGTVSSVQQALVFVGMSNIRNLVLSASAMEIFHEGGEIGPFSRKELWIHSLGCAIAARRLAQASRSLDPETAFTAGLIHDVGKVVLDRFFREDLERIIDLLDRHTASMAEVERSIMGLDHGEIGGYVAQRWRLPDVLQEAISYHHKPLDAPSQRQVASLIDVANAIARELKIGLCLGSESRPSPDVFSAAGVTPEVYDSVSESLPDLIEETAAEMSAA